MPTTTTSAASRVPSSSSTSPASPGAGTDSPLGAVAGGWMARTPTPVRSSTPCWRAGTPPPHPPLRPARPRAGSSRASSTITSQPRLGAGRGHLGADEPRADDHDPAPRPDRQDALAQRTASRRSSAGRRRRRGWRRAGCRAPRAGGEHDGVAGERDPSSSSTRAALGVEGVRPAGRGAASIPRRSSLSVSARTARSGGQVPASTCLERGGRS